MVYFIIVGVIIILCIFFTSRSDKQIEQITNVDGQIDLTQECKLRFVKNDRSEYEVQFLNPIYNSWWALPSGHAGIHAPWSFTNKGSYGAYDLQVLTCTHYEVDGWKKTYRTLNDIQELFNRMNKDYKRRIEDDQRDAALPDIIQ